MIRALLEWLKSILGTDDAQPADPVDHEELQRRIRRRHDALDQIIDRARRYENIRKATLQLDDLIRESDELRSRRQPDEAQMVTADVESRREMIESYCRLWDDWEAEIEARKAQVVV